MEPAHDSITNCDLYSSWTDGYSLEVDLGYDTDVFTAADGATPAPSICPRCLH